MGRIYWIRVDGSEDVIEADISSREVNNNFLKYIKVFENEKNAGVEFVWVLHKDRRTLMLVDEIGALKPLPINIKATDIYHNVSRARGQDWVGPPYIHGDVILFEDIDVE